MLRDWDRSSEWGVRLPCAYYPEPLAQFCKHLDLCLAKEGFYSSSKQSPLGRENSGMSPMILEAATVLKWSRCFPQAHIPRGDRIWPGEELGGVWHKVVLQPFAMFHCSALHFTLPTPTPGPLSPSKGSALLTELKGK